MKYFFITIFVIIVLILLLQIDDDLSAEANDYIQLVESRIERGSEAYLYLSGIEAPAGVDPTDRGKEKLDIHRRAENQKSFFSTVGDESPIEEIDQFEKIESADASEIFNCRFGDADCFQSVLKMAESWSLATAYQKTLLQRYEEFIRFGEYSTLTQPSINSWSPDYRYLVLGQRVKTLSILNTAIRGHHLESIEYVLEDIVLLRKQLQYADEIVYKMVLLSMIAINLDILVFLADAYEGEIDTEISLLTGEERDMDVPFARKFVMSYNMFVSMDRNPEFFSSKKDKYHINAPAWFVRMLFKPNMTTNREVSGYISVIKRSHLSQTSFAKIASEQYDTVYVQLSSEEGSSLRNVYGDLLAGIPGPNLAEWIARHFDLNCKIVLANHVLAGRKSTLTNPYGEDDYKIQTSPDRICMEGPLEDHRNFRCVAQKGFH